MSNDPVKIDEVQGVKQWMPGHTRPWKEGEVEWTGEHGQIKSGSIQEMQNEKDRPSLWRYK